jgi:hypothetical protein
VSLRITLCADSPPLIIERERTDQDHGDFVRDAIRARVAWLLTRVAAQDECAGHLPPRRCPSAVLDESCSY